MFKSSRISRRGFALFGLCGLIGLAAPLPAFALSEQAARDFVNTVSNQVISVLRAPSAMSAKEAQLQALLETHTDFRQIAGSALGRYARLMSEPQKLEYIALFKRYVARAYAGQLGDYNGETIDILRADNLGQRGVYVRTQVNRPGASPLMLDWLVNDVSGSVKGSDMVVEGLSMVQSTRDEFTAMIANNGGNIDAFLQALRARLGG